MLGCRVSQLQLQGQFSRLITDNASQIWRLWGWPSQLFLIICPLLSRLLLGPPGCVLVTHGNDRSLPNKQAQILHHSLTYSYSKLIYMCVILPYARDLQACVAFPINLCMLLWIKRMRPPMGLYRFYFLCWYSPVLRGTLTLAVCWQAEASIDHFSHSKQTKSHHPLQCLWAEQTPGHRLATLGL